SRSCLRASSFVDALHVCSTHCEIALESSTRYFPSSGSGSGVLPIGVAGTPAGASALEVDAHAPRSGGNAAAATRRGIQRMELMGRASTFESRASSRGPLESGSSGRAGRVRRRLVMQIVRRSVDWLERMAREGFEEV